MIEAFVGLVGTVSVVALGWAYNLGTKVAVLEKAEEDYKEFLTQLLDAKFEPVNQRLDRIERKLWNGSSGL